MNEQISLRHTENTLYVMALNGAVLHPVVIVEITVKINSKDETDKACRL